MAMRITGMGSGIDIQSMITAIMEQQRVPIYRLEDEIYEQQQIKSAWTTLDSSIGELRAKAYNLTSSTTWSQMRVSSDSVAVASATATRAAAAGVYEIAVGAGGLAQAHRVAADAQADTTSALGLDGEFTIGGQAVAVSADQSLSAIRDAINLAARDMDADEKVRASIVDTTLVIERVNTGITPLSMADGAGDILESLGVFDAGKAVKNELRAARDLTFSVNGISVTRSSNTGLGDVVAGVTFNITGEGESTVTVGRDVETMKSLIEDFVASYNQVMEVVESASDVEITSSDTDGSSVTAGVLQGESLLREFRTKARQTIVAADTTGVLDSDFASLRQIGIFTSGQANRLALTDPAALDNALAENYDQVESLFRDYQAGVMVTFEKYVDSLVNPIDGRIDMRLQRIESEVNARWDRMDDIERRLVTYEDGLWLQFSRMDEAMSRIETMSSFIASLLPQSKTS